MKRYLFKVTACCRDDMGFPFEEVFEKSVKADSLDVAKMDLDLYCENNDIRAISYDLISVKLERAAVLIGTV